MNFVQRAANGRCAVRHHTHAHPGWDGLLQHRQHLAHLVHSFNHIGAGLLVQHQQDRGLALRNAIGAQVLHRILHIGHVLQTHGAAVFEAQNQSSIVRCAAGLVVGLNLPSVFAVVQHAFGSVRVAAHHSQAHILEGQTMRGQFVGLHGHPHCGQSATANRHLPDTIDLRQALGQHGGGQVVHLTARGRGGGECNHQHRAFCWIGFAVGGAGGHTAGQQALCGVDSGLHITRCAIDVAVQIELQVDAGRALHGTRGHFTHACNRAQGAFQGRGHGGCHGLGAGTGQVGLHRNGREIHLRQRCHRHQAVGQTTGQGDTQTQERGGHRTVDEKRREVHALCAKPQRLAQAPSCK